MSSAVTERRDNLPATPASSTVVRTVHTVGVGKAESFEWSRRKNGDVVILHHGRVATTLRGRRADEFVEDVDDGDGQELMARLTGNYKRGNERDTRNHPRNRDRR